MTSWRRAVQLGARYIRASSRTNIGFTALAGMHALITITVLWLVTYSRQYLFLIVSMPRLLIAGTQTCSRCFASGVTLTQQPSWLRVLTPLSPQLVSIRGFADLPAHSHLTMPSLSPTMSQVMTPTPLSFLLFMLPQATEPTLHAMFSATEP